MTQYLCLEILVWFEVTQPVDTPWISPLTVEVKVTQRYPRGKGMPSKCWDNDLYALIPIVVKQITPTTNCWGDTAESTQDR